MKTNLILVQESRKLLEQSQERQQIKLTLEEIKPLSIYLKLMKLKLSMYYIPSEGDSKVAILKEKYKSLDLSKIDEVINKAWEKVNKLGYLNTYLDYIFENTLSAF